MSVLNVRKLCPELQLIAEQELNEIPERIADDIAKLRKWLEMQPHIKARTDDQYLLSFLRGCKFSLEKTKQKLDTFYTSRSLIPEFFRNRDPFLPEIQTVLKNGMFIPIVNSDIPGAPTVLLVRNAMFEPGVDKFENIYKCMFMILDILLYENDNFVIAGNLGLVDLENITINHYMIPPSYLQKVMMLYQKSYPLRVKGVYYIKISSMFKFCVNVIKPFMTEKLKRRIKCFTDETISELYKEVPRKCLAQQYGGEDGDIQDIIDKLKKKVESYAEWFKEDELYGTDESLRPGKPKTDTELFGIEGSFRKLNVD